MTGVDPAAAARGGEAAEVPTGQKALLVALYLAVQLVAFFLVLRLWVGAV